MIIQIKNKTYNYRFQRMPPKNKKELQEEAKRLQQQQRIKQEEERRLQEERRKYASQKINTGLILPVSSQIITDFLSQQSSFIAQKLKEVLAKQYENLNDQKTISQLTKQTLYHIKNLRKLFELKENSTLQQSKQQYFKIRVVCGIFLSLYLNNHPSLSPQSIKNKQDDENLLRRLLLIHSQSKTQSQQKVFNKNQVIMVLSYFKDHYFSHFLVLHKSRFFPKRQDQKNFTLHVASPYVEFNSMQTTFIDLSGNKQQGHESENGEDKKSED